MALSEKSIKRLQELQERALANIDTAGRNILADYERLVREVTLRARMLLSGMGGANDPMQLQDSLVAIQQMNAILTEAGLGEIIANYQANFKTTYEDAQEYFSIIGVGSSQTAVPPAVLNSLVSVYSNDLSLNIQNRLVPPLKQALLQGAAGNVTFGEVVSRVAAVMQDLPINNVETLVRDSYVRFNRQVSEEVAKDAGLEIAWVEGPDDDVTRPVCQEVINFSGHGVPGMFYRDELEELFPGYSIEGGGWNCRHKVSYITLEFAISLGFEP